MCAMFGARRRGGRRDVSHLRMQIGETSVVFVGRCSVATVVQLQLWTGRLVERLPGVV
jgi:hypothetical protein